MRPDSLTIVSLAALFALPGCQGPYSADSICETIARAQCRFEYQCCNAVEREIFGRSSLSRVHSTEEECFEELRKLICRSVSVYAEGVREGRLTWNEDRARECIEPLEKAADQCDAETYFGGDEGCNEDPPYKGAVKNGDTCYLSEECADEQAVCEPEEPEDPEKRLVTARGTCQPLPGVGEKCGEKPCRAELFCNYAKNPPVCESPRPNGQPCESSEQCQSGYCDSAQCAAKKANGEGCVSDNECQTGYCAFDSSTCADKKPNGEPCTFPPECQSNYCDENSTCADPEPDDNVAYDICTGSGELS